MVRLIAACFVVFTVLCQSGGVFAYDGIVEKQVFEMPAYTTVGGKTIKNLRVGWEAYGKLNGDKSNVILICQFFSGNSHAAGRYSADEKARGYWDSVIGEGKPFDTDKYYIISVDTLANLNTRDPKTITTGPASIDPDTGKPYGMRFPIVGIRDFVNVQKALLDSLGIRSLVAVAGASMGAMQTVDWTVAYPDKVQRAIPVIAPGLETDPYLVATMQLWSMPIRMDPNWNQGDYYGRDEPVQGLAASMKLVTIGARHYGWADKTFGRKWADAARDPAAAHDNQYAIEAFLDDTALVRARSSDANSFLYLTKAVQLWSVRDQIDRIKARMLLLPARSDLLTFPDYSRKAIEPLLAQRTPVTFFEIDGDGGHVDGLNQIVQMGETIRDFLEN